MAESVIPGFDPTRARQFLDTTLAPSLKGVRHRQAIHDLVRLRLMRYVDGVSIADPDWLAYQDTLWPHLAPIMEKQQAGGAWAPLDRDRSGWFHTTPWVLVFLGYLGLNGTVSPAITRAAAYFCDHLVANGPATYACRYAMFLRALLQLGFAGPAAPDAGLRENVHRVCQTHLDWILGRTAHCRATTRRKHTHCACALVKELLFLNAFPPEWRTGGYRQAVEMNRSTLPACVEQFSGCPSNGRQWSEFGYFRHICPSWFEALEALAGSGYDDRAGLEPNLTLIGSRCIDGATWQCDYKAHRSVLLDGKRRTVSWLLNLELKGKPSPWLTLCALEIDQAFASRMKW